jgi:hypothetical protein
MRHKTKYNFVKKTNRLILFRKVTVFSSENHLALINARILSAKDFDSVNVKAYGFKIVAALWNMYLSPEIEFNIKGCPKQNLMK